MAMEKPQSEMALGVVFRDYRTKFFKSIGQLVYPRKRGVRGELIVTVLH